MNIPFSKYSGCGNDFILVDNRNPIFPLQQHDFIPRLCQRRTGIGADGVILLENSTSADFKMRIFNADGSEAEMCGNGVRCLMKFIQEVGINKKSCTIETKQDRVSLTLKNDLVTVSMPNPGDIRWDLELPIEGKNWAMQSLNTGVPHAILFVEDLESPQWMSLAPKIRYHRAFQPKGTNVNFARIEPHVGVRVRTYERGVEGETLACGTGATATAIAAARHYGIHPPILVWPLSNEPLEIDFSWDGTDVKHVLMTGPAHLVFRGKVDGVDLVDEADKSLVHSVHLVH